MAPFRFPLQKVLELREQSERESARGLAAARREADEARRARQDLEMVREAGRAELARAHGKGGAIGHLHNLSYLVDRLEDKIRDAEQACREADEAVARSMRTFTEAVRQRKALDQLRERRLGQWRTEEIRAERRAMDEVALTRHGRARTTADASGEA